MDSIYRSRGKTAYRRAAAAGANGPVNSAAPMISGTTTVGQTLTASAGTWSNSPTLSYQWRRDGSAIAGATGSTYDLVAADQGATISVTETAVTDGIRRTATSAETAAIA